MLTSIVSNGELHVFQVTGSGDLLHGSHAPGTGAFPLATITSGCNPQIIPTTQVFNDNLHIFAQKASGEILWGVAPHGGKWVVKTLEA